MSPVLNSAQRAQQAALERSRAQLEALKTATSTPKAPRREEDSFLSRLGAAEHRDTQDAQINELRAELYALKEAAAAREKVEEEHAAAKPTGGDSAGSSPKEEEASHSGSRNGSRSGSRSNS